MAADTSKAHILREISDCKEAITCAICLEVLLDARTLTCSHTFCLKCLLEYQRDTSQKVRQCPTCRQDTVPTNLSLLDLPQNSFANAIASVIKNFEGCFQLIGFFVGCSAYLCILEGYFLVRIRQAFKIELIKSSVTDAEPNPTH